MATTSKTTKTSRQVKSSSSTKKANTVKKSSPGKTLVIVESPSKGKIIGKYLGSKYKVIASVGHIRDLPKSRLAVDVDNGFEPEYINIRGKASIINEMKKEAGLASKVILATDPDREGEAIAWHLAYLLGIDPSSDCRVMFNEINKDTVKESIKEPKPINNNLFNAQQARRVLDRLVGYKISPLLWKKVGRNLSGGRVQSSTLKLICDREKEIENFIPEEYWYIAAEFGEGFTAELSKISGKKAKVRSAAEAETIRRSLEGRDYIVENIKNANRKIKPYAPFTTSSLQQDASTRLGFQTSRTMSIAQELYEGVSLRGIGERGLITYIRTDSVRVSDIAKASANAFIKENYGSEYAGSNKYASKNKLMQDAHEAIRPSDVSLEPHMIKDLVRPDLYKLYDLIWRRFVASQMASAVYDTVSVSIANGKYEFKASGSRMTFDGWRKVYGSNTEKENELPKLTEGQKLDFKKLITEQKFTQPPSRYTEASIVKEMEEKNIGRPSTYAATLERLFKRRYIVREKKYLVPTQLGKDVTGIMEVYFADIVDVEFTGEMEDKLDSIDTGMDWRAVLADFYKNFKLELEIADKELQRIEREVVLSDESCELCGKPMAIKEGQFGRYLACTGYPECKNTKSIIVKTGVKCPKCGNDILEKRSRRGKIFYGCSGYPSCDVSYWDKPVGRFCPQCKSMLVESNGRFKGIKCSNRECKYKEAEE